MKMAKSMYNMDEIELQALVGKLSHNVERLAYERPDSAEHRVEAGTLSDAKQLLAEIREICQNLDCRHKKGDHLADSSGNVRCIGTKEKAGDFAAPESRACSCTKFVRGH